LEIISQLEKINVFEVLKKTGAVMEGHFKLTSGFHSKYYLQCAKLLEHPDITMELIDYALAENGCFFDDSTINKLDTIVSPAMGGMLFGYMLAYKLKKRMIFTERKEKIMELRRGFELKPNENVIIAEDVITTGGSVFEVMDICKSFNANIIAIISIVDRSEDTRFEYPYFSFIKLNIDKYPLEICPLCKEGIDVVYHGSRK
jgi:orotate phosphoribosyltransferase